MVASSAGVTSLPLGPIELAVLALLVTGMTQAAIARPIHVSPRTVDAIVARVRHAVGATNRYSLGAIAVRSRLVEPEIIINRARSHIEGGRCWNSPSVRQYEVIRRLSCGDTYAVTAAALDMSTRTVRRDLSVLARANGAGHLAAAGALFESLDWHSH